MKKIIFILTMMSTFTFSNDIRNSIVELKGTVSAGYDFYTKDTAFINELTVYRKFEEKKINTIFNVGGGLDITHYYGKAFMFRPYIATEIGGYVSPNTKLYTDLKLGLGLVTDFTDIVPFSKVGVGFGVLYKHVSVEIGYNFPGAITLGFGTRLGF